MKSMYCVDEEHMSIAPAATLSNPIYTPAVLGAVGVVVEPEQEMAPHVILLVARFFN